MCMCVCVRVCVCSFSVSLVSTHIIHIICIYSCYIHVISWTWISHIICIYSWSIHVYLLNMNKLVERNPPPGGVFYLLCSLITSRVWTPLEEPGTNPSRGVLFFSTFFQNLQFFWFSFSFFCFPFFFPNFYFQCSFHVIDCHFCCPIPAQTRLSLSSLLAGSTWNFCEKNMFLARIRMDSG